MSLFFLGIAIAGLEYPDKPFFSIPSLTNLSISLSILDFISSFTVKGLMKNGVLSVKSKCTCICGPNPILSLKQNASLYFSKDQKAQLVER